MVSSKRPNYENFSLYLTDKTQHAVLPTYNDFTNKLHPNMNVHGNIQRIWLMLAWN